MNILIFSSLDSDFSVFMYDDAFWSGHGYAVRFDCSASELQAGIKKALVLYQAT